MSRLNALVDREFDVLIIGAGIYGSSLGWYAARAGLRVALIDKGDIGAGASANSLKIIHGGLRYLQQLDLPRIRESIRARRDAFQQLPHLARTLPFVMPTGRGFKRSPFAYRIAGWLTDAMAFDRNRGLPESHGIPRTVYWSRSELAAHGPPLQDVRGALAWRDGLLENSERFTLAYALSAQRVGAEVATYTAARSLLRDGHAVRGAVVRDEECGGEAELRARITVNATGCWRTEIDPPVAYVRAFNIVVNKRWFGEYGVGLDLPDTQAPRRGFFFVPWRSGTMIGTVYTPFDPARDTCELAPGEIARFVDDINRIYPPAELTVRDVTFVHLGVQPAARPPGGGRTKCEPAHDTRLVDYRRFHNMDGYWRILGVKYTTAAVRMQRMALLLSDRLGHAPRPGIPGPLYGGEPPVSSADVSRAAREEGWDMSTETAAVLAQQYGSRCTGILALGRTHPEWRTLIPRTAWPEAAIVYALREEQARHADDILLRRTDIGSFAAPAPDTVEAVVCVMARERPGDANVIREQEERWSRVARTVYPAG